MMQVVPSKGQTGIALEFLQQNVETVLNYLWLLTVRPILESSTRRLCPVGDSLGNSSNCNNSNNKRAKQTMQDLREKGTGG